MRTYTKDSPQAAARILTLAMLADGHLAKAELDALDRLGVHYELGLERSEFLSITHAFCEDLLAAAQTTCWADACRISPQTLTQLMAEVDDPVLRLKLLRLCLSLVIADEHVAEGELVVLQAAVDQWDPRHTGMDADLSRPSVLHG